MIADEICKVKYLEYDLKNNMMTINYEDGSSVSAQKTISEFLMFESLIQSRGKYGRENQSRLRYI